MTKATVCDVRPSGWANPQEEWRRLSPLDITAQLYNSYFLIFKLQDNANKEAIVENFKTGLQATASQCRHIAGKIEKNEHGDFSIVTKPDSKVGLTVQDLDGPDDKFPSYSELENGHFCAELFGDPTVLTIKGMFSSNEASPASSPAVAGFQLSFIPGGLILTLSLHHFAMDVAGMTGLIHQVAANCAAAQNGTTAPAWEESLVDRSRFIPPPTPESALVDPPPMKGRNPKWMGCSWLFFHMPHSKTVELKKLATPTDGSWISTYDAVLAYIWRVLSKTRSEIYKPELTSTAILGETVNMRKRLSPPVPKRYQGNIQCGGLSSMQKEPLTLADVISDAPLSKLASFIRKITNDVTPDALDKSIARVAPVRDKSKIQVRLDSLPPMSLAVTDWRDIDICEADFGFGRPAALRQMCENVVDNLLIIYPRRTAPNVEDLGLELVVPFETHAVQKLIEDEDVKKFLTFVGFEAGAPAS